MGLTNTEVSLLRMDRPQFNFRGLSHEPPEKSGTEILSCDRCGRTLDTDEYALGSNVYCAMCYKEVKAAQQALAAEINKRDASLILILLAMTLYQATDLPLTVEYEDLTIEDVDDMFDFMEEYCSDNKGRFIKVLKTIRSCQTEEQLKVARTYVDIYHNYVGYRVGLLYKLLHKKSADLKSAHAAKDLQKTNNKNL